MTEASVSKRLWRTCAAAVVALSATGCSVVDSLTGQVSNPLTPAQSRAQVVDAAQEIVHALGIQVVKSYFWRASCNDDGDPPFRGRANITYPLAPSFEQSDAEVAHMVEHLQTLGWTGDSGFHSHSPAVKKDNVVVVFDVQAVSDRVRGIDLYGECRDTTTTKDTKGSDEFLTYS
ncbi:MULTISPECIES: hypothetical protein [Mycobacterium]|uniref:hypothetical protein n=1 Tax=Mycobacterium TaxID=1763 RepID=UPI001EEFAB73|nr:MULTISPECIES: hypothetical protein [Mycobacterium]